MKRTYHFDYYILRPQPEFGLLYFLDLQRMGQIFCRPSKNGSRMLILSKSLGMEARIWRI